MMTVMPARHTVIERISRERARMRLEGRLQELRLEIERGSQEVRALTESEADEFVSQHPADLGTALYLVESAVSTREALRREMALVEDALRRIDQGTHGICVDCRKRIAPERLEVLPYTPRCIDCERAFERAQRRRP